jgi:NAD(P)-dependent dehydrogenase (short-subunit alcohol dehydrogenase family)
MTQLVNRVAAITGAASGIGRALAVNLARRGCSVALADVASRHGKVSLIVNNAGVAISDSLEEVSDDDLRWILDINLWGVIWGSKAFLPHLKQQDEGHIVNVSSVHGLFTNPGVGPYCTTKFAVKGFTLALCQELKETGVRVSCVHPGGIKTNIARNSRFRKSFDPDVSQEEAIENFKRRIARTSADKAARIILSGVERNKKRILVGPDTYLLDWYTRLAPVGWQKLMSGDWPILTALLLSPLLFISLFGSLLGREES